MTDKQYLAECKSLLTLLHPRKSHEGKRTYYSSEDLESIKRLAQIGRDSGIPDLTIAHHLHLSHGFLSHHLGGRTEPVNIMRAGRHYQIRHPNPNRTHDPEDDDKPSLEVEEMATHATGIARAMLTIGAPAHEVEELAFRLMRAGKDALRDVYEALSVTTELPTTPEAVPEEPSPRAPSAPSEAIITKKAALCVVLARKLLPTWASEDDIQEQAFSLMHMPDHEVTATSMRMARWGV